ncbi:YbaY family lipoprotein [Frateuria sp. STR12]|uniref:YbaY family lipoprotein n=1 Tax=Frateuria hangzhouensis TaxID=2995589 RepID=UPI002260F13F|nr:YbaY family lipoprotein [Frateuria sp. STR12]MCX7512517.1 YbaY family lipoprotein [Frateuria sp. STR12]
MRRMVWSLMSVAALALAGCNGSNAPDQGNEGNAAAVKADSVSGTITVRGDNAVSPEAKLVVNLVDVSSTDQAGAAPLASKSIAPVQFPQSFELTFNPADVNPADLYVVKTELTDGERHYKMALQAPVLTKGAPNQVSIELVPEQTAAEKELAEFQSLQKQIGGMKISDGTKLEKDVSRAWQVFRQDGQVKFIRGRADYGDKGFTSTDYAYKDGKPWVVVQQKKASQDAKPSSIERASWDKDGNLVLKQVVSGGNTSASLGDDQAASLKQQAQDILKLATGGKGK